MTSTQIPRERSDRVIISLGISLGVGISAFAELAAIPFAAHAAMAPRFKVVNVCPLPSVFAVSVL
jgi:hypothetical protein